MTVGANSPTISVVMPLFNKRPFVARAVASVLAQSRPPLELLVVDDGSTDGGEDELAGIQDPRLRIIRQDNAGVAAARNRGIGMARGEWIALIDADDLWAPDHLAELAAMAAAQPTAGLLATATQEVWSHKAVPPASTGSGAVRRIDYFAAATRNGHVVTASSAALRRDVAIEIGGFRDLRPGEDIDCWIRIALGWPVFVSDRVTAFYLRGTGSSAMDGWGAGRGPLRKIHSRREFGGTVAVIDEALASGRHDDRRSAMQRYADQRMLHNAGKSLAAGDRRGAAERLRLLYRRAGSRYWAYRCLSLLPGGAVRAGIAASRGLRHRLRR